MKVYTYCSYKGSLKGFQYAIFDLTDENASSMEVHEMKNTTTGKHCLPVVVKEWFEQKSDWKIVLFKSDVAGEGILLFAKVEKANELDKLDELDRIEEIKAGNKFRNNPKNIKSKELSSFDSRFFINLAFEGKIDELRYISAGILHEIYKDGGRSLLRRIEKAYYINEDKNRYFINVGELNEVINVLRNPRCEVKRQDLQIKKSLLISKQLLSRFIVTPHIRLQGVLDKNTRKQLVGQAINTLVNKKEYSQKIIMYVSEDSNIEKYGTANIEIELDCLLPRR